MPMKKGTLTFIALLNANVATQMVYEAMLHSSLAWKK